VSVRPPNAPGSGTVCRWTRASRVFGAVFGVWWAVGLGFAFAGVAAPFSGASDFLFIFWAACWLFALEGKRYGAKAACAALVWVAAASGILEFVGALTGWPFGDYRYTDAFGPRIAGVPCAIPLAWYVVVLPAFRWSGARVAPEGRNASARAFSRVVFVAGASVAFDLAIEPVATVERGYWIWDGGGAYYGVPALNFGGWAASAAAIALGLLRVERMGRAAAEARLDLGYALAPGLTLATFVASLWMMGAWLAFAVGVGVWAAGAWLWRRRAAPAPTCPSAAA